MICVGRAILTTQVAAIENWQADGRPHGSKGGTGLEQIIDAQRLQADQASKIDVGVKGSTGLLDPACGRLRSEEHTSELQSLMRISYAVFCLKKKKKKRNI